MSNSSKPAVLVLAKATSAAAMEELERAFTCLHLWQQEPGAQDAFIERVAPDVRGVFTTGIVGITAARIAQLPALEVIAVHGTGVDKIALPAAHARGIAVTNTPGVLTDDVADLAVALILASARSLPQLDRHVRSGAWEAGAPLAPGRSIRGKVAGLYGFGAIGQAIAMRLLGFGMKLRYFQRSEVAGSVATRSASLMALAEESDYLMAAVPGGPATEHAINREVLAALGPQGTLVNIARGSVVDEAALIEALDAGTLGAAALDVYQDEPRVPASLRERANVVLTPHAGSLTVETRYAMGKLAIDNLLAHFSGGPLLTPVKPA
jgi:lactate dehydrogenase-like 2-hydroxyacid dehydrogenase